ncbi:type II and III secretion system protein family protein [Erythrobacter sp.]|uniref:type II and III secretion system protein family protein n=1 Tax=Erythrobacter sp. TaxID=1042 RepID=UPI001B2330CD|nr:type II and III secretion system protein family protein [Erythrobacter sp.]MBO6525734.1 pilus assembly protein N-terminal domain-containing protein [Erythrobacter sp.]MBO6529591.1 pilus assembly protein N-terminal domain-containing protein [Erythrobacter sp.]
MKRRLTTKLLLASLAVTPLAAAPTTVATAQTIVSPSSEIVLSIGRGELVNVPGTMADVFVADDNIADVQVKSQRQLYVFGKSGGETTIYASNRAGDIVWSANIRVGSNIGSVDQLLALAMPEAEISVATMGTNVILLTGTVAAPEDAEEAQRLVEAFVGDGTNVISRLRMATPLQVNLQVRIAEVSRSFVRALGVNLATVDNSSGFKFGIGQGRTGAFPQYTPGSPAGLGVGVTDGPEGSSVVANISPGTTVSAFGKFLGLDIASALDLAETEGLVTTLSQPNLTALSGETAEFLAGGEFPIPLSQGLGTTTIEYKNYGVSLAYSPTVLANGRISMRVRPEVSELSSQGAITLDGFQVPALITRRAETTVELGSGQSFMIAGLLSNNATNSIDKAPGLGDVPILGNLFRSTTYRKGETELVIVVTPYLVKPVDANDIKLPTDGFRTPTEGQRVFGYQQSDGVTGGERPGPSAVESEPAAPGISQGVPTDNGAQQAQSQPDARRNERSTPAKPGFSFE